MTNSLNTVQHFLHPTLLLQCLLISSLVMMVRAVKVPETEMAALSEFFFHTNGPHWTNKNGWETLMADDGPSNPCANGLNSW
jgi:hypothetical protein